jgi:mannose-1-phosphate guanylyltransferase/mannose-6-phosphate isomerase
VSVVPVILCGGGGTRLWPASTPQRPKGLMSVGGRSLLGATLDRCRGLSDAPAVVVAAADHADAVRALLASRHDPAELLLETAPRDTAPAMLAGARLAAARDPETVVALLPCDHHVGDEAAFRAALRQAGEMARDGRLVLLGVTPDRPSPAYGHIRPQRPGPSPVQAFVEKPDPAGAARLTAEGCLWNAGILVARADVLWAEAQRHAPEVARAVADAVTGPGRLGPAFAASPRISMDYAVLEKTDRAWVLPVDFGWSDLGAWDAVAAHAPSAPFRGVDADGAWVQAPDGVQVAVVGLPDVIVVVEDGAVLVCARDAAQQVRRVADQS